jgi:hypothetical protein
MSASRNGIVCLKVIARQFVTETGVNGVKWPFCRSCFCFSQLGLSRVRANRFCFKGWNCRVLYPLSQLYSIYNTLTVANSKTFRVVNKTYGWSNFGEMRWVDQEGGADHMQESEKGRS